MIVLGAFFPSNVNQKWDPISGLAGADKALTQNLHPDASSRSFGFNDGEWIYGWTHAVFYVFKHPRGGSTVRSSIVDLGVS